MDEGTTWYGSTSRPRPHCIRRCPNSPQKGHSNPPPRPFGPCLLWPRSPISLVSSCTNGRPKNEYKMSTLHLHREEHIQKTTRSTHKLSLFNPLTAFALLPWPLSLDHVISFKITYVNRHQCITLSCSVIIRRMKFG